MYIYTVYTRISFFANHCLFRHLRWFLILFSGSCTNCATLPHIWLNKGEVSTATWLNYTHHYAQSCQTCKKNDTKEQKSMCEVPEPRLLWCEQWSSCSVSAPCAGVALCCVQSPHPSTSKRHMKEFSLIWTNPVWEKTEPAHRSVSAKTSLPHDAKSSFCTDKCNFGKVGCWNWDNTGPLKYIKSETGTYICWVVFIFAAGLSCPDPVLVAKWGY